MNQAARHSAVIGRVPPPALFVGSSVFHYLGPSFAVLLFARLDAIGVAWLRIVSAAVIFAIWRFAARSPLRFNARTKHLIIAFGVVLAAMNVCFYLAIAKLPLASVAAIEFLGPIALAAHGARTWRNGAALAITVLGVAAIMRLRIAGEPLAFAFAVANCVLFMLYVVLGHRIAHATERGTDSIDSLAAAMAVAALVIMPIGFGSAMHAFSDLQVLLGGVGVGICSSVIPYVLDQLAMARLSRGTFALMLSILPACAALIGAIVLAQFPTELELAGIALVTAGIAIHRDPEERNNP